MSNHVVGEFQLVGKVCYVVTNSRGTLEKLGRAKWWRILALQFLQAIGKRTSIAEVKSFLFPHNGYNQ